MTWNNAEYDDEEHELIITKEELEEAKNHKLTASQFVIESACRKANRLGRDKRKIKEVQYTTIPETGDWVVKYLCEYDPF